MYLRKSCAFPAEMRMNSRGYAAFGARTGGAAAKDRTSAGRRSRASPQIGRQSRDDDQDACRAPLTIARVCFGCFRTVRSSSRPATSIDARAIGLAYSVTITFRDAASHTLADTSSRRAEFSSMGIDNGL
jgi:hypothetical protein